MKKDIYIIKNTVNNKVYIGQSQNTAERWKQHIYDARYESKSNQERQIIHRAMNKYGCDKFYCEILESQIENYDERERYWIWFYGSIVPNGYNVAPGGGGSGTGIDSVNAIFTDRKTLLKCISEISSGKKSFSNIAKKFNCSYEVISAINNGKRYCIEGMKYPLRQTRYSSEKIRQVRYAIKYETDLSFKDISKRYHIDYSQVSLINQGKIYFVDSETYPLRTKRRQDLPDDIIDAVYDDIINSELSLSKIAAKYNVSRMRISGINQGHFYVRDGYEYPLRSCIDERNQSYKKYLDPETISEIIDLLRTDISIRQIAERFGLSSATICNINNGSCKRYIQDGVRYPIRQINHRQPVSTICV